MPTTTRRPVRTPWYRPEAPKEPEDSARAKALRLPRPGPGIAVKVSLDVLMEFLEIYQLQPSGIQEPRNPSKDGPGEAILLVERVNVKSEAECRS